MQSSVTQRAVSPLQRLPVEILQQVAWELDAESALALTRTCSGIRQACYTKLVFKTILADESDFDPGCYWHGLCFEEIEIDTSGAVLGIHFHLPELCWSDVVQYVGEDVTAWADLAIADCRAREEAARIPKRPNTLSYTFPPSVDTFLRACPHLIWLKHPLTGAPFVAYGLAQEVDLFRRTNSLNDPRLSLWYCASMIAWAPAPWELKLSHVVNRTATRMLHHFMRQDSPLTQRHFALLGLGATATLLRVKVQEARNDVSRTQPNNQNALDVLIHPPAFCDIRFPYLSKYKLPGFYRESDGLAQSKWGTWLDNYSQGLTVREYMEDTLGWTCYYLRERLDVLWYVVPRRQIVFSTRPSEFTRSTLIEAPWGDDGVSRVYGLVRTNGRGHAVVHDTSQAIITSWEFTLTPFGIFGRFGTNGSSATFQRPSDWEIEYKIMSPQHLLGTFWLWKEDFNQDWIGYVKYPETETDQSNT